MTTSAGEILTDLWNRKFGLDALGNLILGTGGKVGVIGAAFGASAVVGAGASNVALVTITVTDPKGNAIAYPQNFDLWLSDSAAGVGLTATTASGAVAKGANGADLGDLTAKKMKRVQTDATGLYQLSITDTAKTHFNVCVDIGKGPVVVASLVTASYGA